LFDQAVEELLAVVELLRSDLLVAAVDSTVDGIGE
jgi:hypothetical protein